MNYTCIIIDYSYTHTDDHVADIFTKAMIEKKETNLPKEIGLWQ
jgi:hypothetical protein